MSRPRGKVAFAGKRVRASRLRLEMLETRLVPCHDEFGAGELVHAGHAHGSELPELDVSAVADSTQAAAPTGSSLGVAATESAMSLPMLSSLPGANTTVYLNFLGGSLSSWLGYSNINTPAYDTDGNAGALSASEVTAIGNIWQVVSQAYAPFNINVTTIDPRTVSGSAGRVSQLDIGGNGAWTGGTYGGIGQLGGISSSSVSNPVRGFVFTANLGNGNAWYTGQAAVHESGHNMGLNHHSAYSGSTKTAEYQSGPGDGTAPFLGNSYSATRGMWWYGASASGSTSYQNDLAVISGNGSGYRADEAGGNAGSASPLSVSGNQISTTGILTSMTDVDVWSFSADAGSVSLTVSAPTYGTLRPKMQVLDSAGNVVAGWLDPDTASVTWTGSLSAGTYHLVVASHGVSLLSTATNYGFNVGQYQVTGTVNTPANFIAAPTSLNAAAASSSQINLSWTDNAGNETGYVLERSTDGANWSVRANLAANSTAYADGGLGSGVQYFYRVRALNGTTTSAYSNQASATTAATPPAAPSALTATRITSTQVRLNWIDNSSNESGFHIERAVYNKRGNLGTWSRIATVGAGVNSYFDNTVAGNKYYAYRIQAYNSGGVSAYANATPFKVQGGPARAPLAGELVDANNRQTMSSGRSTGSFVSGGKAVDLGDRTAVDALFTGLDNTGLDRSWSASEFRAAALGAVHTRRLVGPFARLTALANTDAAADLFGETCRVNAGR